MSGENSQELTLCMEERIVNLLRRAKDAPRILPLILIGIRNVALPRGVCCDLVIGVASLPLMGASISKEAIAALFPAPSCVLGTYDGASFKQPIEIVKMVDLESLFPVLLIAELPILTRRTAATTPQLHALVREGSRGKILCGFPVSPCADPSCDMAVVCAAEQHNKAAVDFSETTGVVTMSILSSCATAEGPPFQATVTKFVSASEISAGGVSSSALLEELNRRCALQYLLLSKLSPRGSKLFWPAACPSPLVAVSAPDAACGLIQRAVLLPSPCALGEGGKH